VDPALWFIVLLILIVISSFFSASETAFSSVNQIRLRHYMEDGRKGSRVAYEVNERFEDVLLVIVIMNNVVNFAAAGIAAIVALETMGEAAAVLGTLLLTIIMIIFGELLPKSYARENAENLVLKISGLYVVLLFVLKPAIWILRVTKNVFRKNGEVREDEHTVTEDELDVIINTMEEEGVLEEDEADMLQGVLDLSETFVKNIMTPRVDVKSINITATVEEAKQKFLDHKFSRIPIYQDDHDNIVGLLYERDLFVAIIEYGDAVDLGTLIKEPVYVSSSMRVSNLLDKLREEKQHLAVVIDEHGSASGVVTMEDVLEEVVGEIYDEHDEDEELITKRSDTIYEVSAEFALDELCALFNVNLREDEDVVPIGSWLYEKLEDIPKVDDEYTFESLRFRVTSVENMRIMRVLVEYKSVNEDDE